MRPYILKRKDDDIAVINITEEGAITDYRLIEENSRLAPLHAKGSTDWLKSWWKRRAVPIDQGHIKAIGHIGIHLQHRNEAVGKKKRVLPVRILKAAGDALVCAVAAVFIGYFGMKNVRFVKAFAGAPNPVFEDCYVDLNGQEQFIRVMGRNVDNPVILLHGGPGSPDGFVNYSFMDYLLDDYTYITWDQRGKIRRRIIDQIQSEDEYII